MQIHALYACSAHLGRLAREKALKRQGRSGESRRKVPALRGYRQGGIINEFVR
ncbi:Uncharacterised protein [Yersinia pseudotuberculosis]|nr:hypothetical protein DJ40_2524 [Yersinia pseudotuberculosis]AJJ06464.1 hypothetical protein BZ20_2222 [Yersinia pseudotuberculosis]CNK30915.1 Uncharacterised protein [Yersinia pseudotuberculosis]CNK59079.1 Uncharacterised protein [Yersinia pseudotuberculosis]SUP88412.1 Uncharacterised protein [Yersinia pseudotuberculosis]